MHSDSLITYAVGTAVQSHRFSSSNDVVCLALRVIALSSLGIVVAMPGCHKVVRQAMTQLSTGS